MGNALSSTPAFLQPQPQHRQHSSSPNQQQHQPQKPLKDRPNLNKEPAFKGYVAGWRQSSFDADAQEFSFATFQQQHHPNSSGYEGDDEDGPSTQDGAYQHADTADRVKGKLAKEEFEDLGRGRGLGRSGSKREEAGTKEVVVEVGKTWKERKWDPSMERKLERVRQSVAEEYALPVPAGRRREAGVGVR